VSQHQAHLEPPVCHMYVLISFPEFSPHSQHKGLVDSGAAGNIMDRRFAHRLGIPLVQMDKPCPVHSLDSRTLGSGVVREATAPLDMVMQGGHEERISLFLIDSPVFPVVLRIPSLAFYNPIVSWQQRALKGWSEECSGWCVGVSISATMVESPDQISTVRIPPEYANLATAFCKKRATQLPPHRQEDCAINLLVNSKLHTSQESRVSPVTGQHPGVAFSLLTLKLVFCGYYLMKLPVKDL
jgi:hypothetical protein